MDKKTQRIAAGLVVVILLTAAAGMIVGSWLPYIGEHSSPANSYLSPHYIINAMKGMFGVRLIFSNDYSTVRIVLLRNILKSKVQKFSL